LDGDVQRVLRLKAAAFYFCRERFALDVLHNDKTEPALFAALGRWKWGVILTNSKIRIKRHFLKRSVIRLPVPQIDRNN
jgi:hypothetical protein